MAKFEKKVEAKKKDQQATPTEVKFARQMARNQKFFFIYKLLMKKSEKKKKTREVLEYDIPIAKGDKKGNHFCCQKVK